MSNWRQIVLFSMPFRVFFLSSALLALVSMMYWGMFWQSPWPFSAFGGPLFWHAHEMVYGFAGAVLVGFLMTAVRNWTGMPTIRGLPLFLAAFCWLLSRLLMLNEQSDPRVLIAFSGLFWLIPTAFFTHLVLRAKMWRNLLFVLVFVAMALLDMQSLAWNTDIQMSIRFIYDGVFVMLLAVTIIAGRVFPFFTANATGTPRVAPAPSIEISAIMIHLVWLVWIFFIGLHERQFALAVLAVLTAAIHTLRFLRWNFAAALTNPMLWSLYAGYLFLIIGFSALALFHLALIDNVSAALHLLTVGTIAGLIYSMTTRVSLGHTGRMIVAGRNIVFGFVLMISAGLIRGLLPLILPAAWVIWTYWLSALIWCVAFAIWAWEFTPILLRSRVDGKPG